MISLCSYHTGQSLCWQLALFIATILLVSCTIPLPKDKVLASKGKAGDCVIMMHGLARSKASMKPMRSALLAHDYLVVSLTYPSRSATVEELSSAIIPTAIAACRSQDAKKIHIVSHSMGGILVRHFLKDNHVTELGRFVMLAPPNQGSQIVDKLGKLPGFEWFMGPAGMQLGTGIDSIPQSLGPVNVDTAVIAGTKSINLFLSLLLPNPDDGKVSVASTRVAGMCALLTFPIAHPFIMKDARVITEVLNYISTGSFKSENADYFDCAVNQETYVDDTTFE